MLSTEYALSPLVLSSTLEIETLLLSVLQSRKSRGAQAEQHPRACQQQSWGLDAVPHSLSCSAQLLPGVQGLLATAVVFTFHFIQSLVWRSRSPTTGKLPALRRHLSSRPPVIPG